MGKNGSCLLRLLTGFLFLFVLVLAAAYLFLTPLVKKAVAVKVAPLFENRLQFAGVGISVPTRSIIIKEVVLQQPPGFGPGNLLKVEAIRLQVALRPLLEKKVVVNGLTVLNPEVNLVQLPGGRTNAEYYFAKFAKKENPQKPPAFRFHLDNLSLRDGRIKIFSRSLSRKEPALEITGVNLLVGNLNFPNEQKVSSPFRVNASAAADHPVSVLGRGKITLGAGPLDFDSVIELKGIELADFAYLFPDTKVSVVSGQAGVKAVGRCRSNYLESTQHVEVKDLKLAGKGGFLGKMIMGLPSAAVVKFLEDKNGVLVLDFRVAGTIDSFRANPKEAIGNAFNRSFREKFNNPFLGVGRGIGAGVQKVGEGLKKIFHRPPGGGLP